MQLVMEHSEAIQKEVGFRMQEGVLRSNSFKQNGLGAHSSDFDEKIIAECDSDWDEIIGQLSVSRMVNDCIIKGIMEDSADIIADKESEILVLREKLQVYEIAPSRALLVRPNNSKMVPNIMNSDHDTSGFVNHVNNLRLEVEEQLQLLNQNLRYMQSNGLNGELCKTCPEEKQNTKQLLHEVYQAADALKDVLVAGFEQISQMVCSNNSELQWQHELQNEIHASLILDYNIELQKEYGTRVHEQSVLEKTWKESWQIKVAELETLRNELHVILEELNSHENSEKGTVLKRKDQFRIKTLGDHIFPSQSEDNVEETLKLSGDSVDDLLDIADLPHLKQMSKEDLISYFKSEMTNMKRRHESKLQEKTEEFFRLYRKLLNEKGSLPLKREREFENLKVKIPNFISSLDKILAEKDISPSNFKGNDILTNFKDEFDLLFSDNKRLKFLLAKKTKEIKETMSHISVGTSQTPLHPLLQAKYLKQIRKLEMDLEDISLEATLQDDLQCLILRELIDEHRHTAEDTKINAECILELYHIIFKEIVFDAISTFSFRLSKIKAEKDSAEALLFQKDKVLKLEVEEKTKLKEELMLLSTFMKEKEKFASEAKSELARDKELLNLLQQELDMHKEKISKQKDQISEFQLQSTSANQRLKNNMEKIQKYEQDINKLNVQLQVKSDALDEAEKQITELLQQTQLHKHETARLNEKLKVESYALEEADKKNSMFLHQIQEHAAKTSKLNENLKIASDALEEADKQNTKLELENTNGKLKIVSDALEEAGRKNIMLLSTTQKYQEQKMQLESIGISAQQLSNGIANLESQLTRNTETTESRLDILNHKFRRLVQQASLHRKMLEIRCSDLQKAEAEVDILADELETLYVLLGKIYLTLDHYAPVLQHYSGIIEILKLIHRQLNGENI